MALASMDDLNIGEAGDRKGFFRSLSAISAAAIEMGDIVGKHAVKNRRSAATVLGLWRLGRKTLGLSD
ncbi:MAG: hypothetical protein ACI845_001506 [Gammaproteobacteria bacterium]|jgi:hypothetical protein